MELLKGQMVEEVRITAAGSDGASSAYSPSYSIAFEELRFSRMDITTVPGISEYFRFERFAAAMQPVGGGGRFAWQNETWRTVLASPAPSRWTLDVPQGATSVRVGFGMHRDSWAHELKTAGVDFRVYSGKLLADNQLEINRFWSRPLYPTSVEADRGIQFADIPLPNPAPAKLMFETSPFSENSPAQSYWADAEFR